MALSPSCLQIIIASVKEDGFGSLNIASKVLLRNNQTPALYCEMGQRADGNCGAVRGHEGHLEEGWGQGKEPSE